MLYSVPEKLLTFFGIQCIEIVTVSLTNDHGDHPSNGLAVE